MERIVVTRKDGRTTYVLNTSGVMVSSAKQVRSLLEEDYVDVELESVTVPDIRLGDVLEVYGRRYTVNQLPEVDKLGSRCHSVAVRFEGVQYTMSRVTYMLSVDTTSLSLQDVRGNSLIGDISVFMEVMVSNLNRVFPGEWAVGAYPSDTSSDTLINFEDGSNCLSALQTICDVFDSEFDITTVGGVNHINIRERNVVFPYPFKYGKKNGLYELSRSNADTANIVNKMYVYGSDINLHGYLCDRLLLRNKTKATSFVKDDTQIALNGLYEGVRVYDDIYPEREGTVSAVDPNNPLVYTDSGMFNLNENWTNTTTDYSWWLSLNGLEDTTESHDNYRDNVVGTTKYLIAGKSAIVHFNTGNLAGYDFEVSSYDNVYHRFTLKRQVIERDMEIPSGTDQSYQICVGDKYTMKDVMLPESYITSAQQRLLSAAQSDLGKLCVPRVKYELKIDELYIKEHCPDDMVAIDCGDYVTITDADFVGSNTNVRVRRVERNLLSRYEYVLELEDVSVFRERRRIARRAAIEQMQITVRDITNNVDFHQNQIVNVVLDKKSKDPSNPEEGQIYYNTIEKKAKQYDGYEFKEIGPDIMNAYGICNDIESNNNKLVTPLHGYKSTVPGGFIAVHFVNGVRANATMKVGTSGTSHPIYYNGAPISGGVIRAGDTALFTLSSEYYFYGAWVLLNAQPKVPRHIESKFYAVDIDEHDNYLFQPAKTIIGGHMIDSYTEDELISLINDGNSFVFSSLSGMGAGRQFSCNISSNGNHIDFRTYAVVGGSMKFLKMELRAERHPDLGEVWHEVVEFSI